MDPVPVHLIQRLSLLPFHVKHFRTEISAS
jgi:hypothetical protein